MPISRRALFALPALALAAPPPKPRVAVVMNVWFPDSHADVFVTRLLDGYRLDHAAQAPRLETVAFYVDQFPANDMSREEADEHNVRIYPTVTEALRAGRARLAVDSVVVIGEHGSYPRTPRGNVMYPRAKYFDEITRVMRQDGRILPMYLDKYFAYEWTNARRIYNTIRELRIPVVCGSTVPRSWQRPPLNLSRGTPLTEVLATSYSDLEEHAYHGIEALQSVAERRGPETGVARVRWCGPEQLEAAAQAGGWSRALLEAALARRVNAVPAGKASAPQAFLIRYRDGLRGSLLHLESQTRDFCVAASVRGRAEPVSTCFYIQLRLHNHWSFIVHEFEDLVLTGKQPVPIERTLLANGIMLAGLESKLRKGQWVETPELAIAYS